MYAIIADGGRQYKVEEGQQLDVDLRDASAGDKVVFDSVLAVRGKDGFQIGKPNVEGAQVTAEVVGVAQGDKVSVRKMRRRKNSRRHTGHRSLFTRVKIGQIKV